MSNKEHEGTSTRDFIPPTAVHDTEKAENASLGQVRTADFNEGEALGHRATYFSTNAAAQLSQEHRDYLIQRHGTLDLDPMPSDDPADPYNWPKWKKNTNLALVAFQSCMTTFIAAAIIPAYEPLSIQFNTTITRVSYLTSLQIAVLGFAPLVWKPLMQHYGRRPFWLISTFCAALFNIGCALSNDYTSMAVCRAFCAFFISASYIGSAVVTETFFKKERAFKMGIWTALVTLGPPGGPFIMGFVAQYLTWRWIYWILAIINFVEFVLAIFFAPETRYIRRGVENRGSAFKQEYLQFFRRIDPSPFTLKEFLQPITLFKYPTVVVPTVAYAIVFGFCSVLLTVEIPQLFIPKFGLGPQAIGLQFISIIIGTVLGEQLGGRFSDWFMGHRHKQIGRKPAPEHRLWLSYIGYTLVVVGFIVFCIQLQNIQTYNVTPVVGVAITAAGNQIITTTLVTYAIDCHVEQSGSIGVFVNLVRSTWGFIGPFWFPPMFEALGIENSAGVIIGMVAGISIIPTIILHFMGSKKHKASSRKV
ncbi:hypothetical protein MBLNU457_4417t1 [Dothideomycetes sp. NU457]